MIFSLVVSDYTSHRGSENTCGYFLSTFIERRYIFNFSNLSKICHSTVWNIQTISGFHTTKTYQKIRSSCNCIVHLVLLLGLIIVRFIWVFSFECLHSAYPSWVLSKSSNFNKLKTISTIFSFSSFEYWI